MKKITLLLLFSTLLPGTSAWAGCTRTIRGSGHPAYRTLPATSFEALHASRAVHVRLTDTADSIRIEADDNLIDYVTVRKKGNTLHVSLAPHIQVQRPRIRVSVPTDGRIAVLKASSSASVVSETDLKGECVRLEASGSADLVAAVTAGRCELAASSSADLHAGVRARECSIHASSSADITAVVVTENCDVNASSSADVTLKGEARTCRAACSSSVDFEAPHFIVETYDIAVSSAADAVIHCTGLLRAQASSAGTIDYRGDCRAETNASGSGRIQKK